MRPTWAAAEPHRIISGAGPYDSSPGDNFGSFLIPHRPTGVKLRVIAASGEGARAEFGDGWAWDHVSVSVVMRKRCPNWAEMAFIKSVFWDDDEAVMQLHVPAEDHINCHPYVLHLWRPLLLPIPLPPSRMVGVPGDLEAQFIERDRLVGDLAAGRKLAR